MSVKTIKSNTIEWHYLNDFGVDEYTFLKKNFKFHPLDLKDCAGEPQRTKIDVYKNYLFIIFQFPYFEGKNVKIIQVYFFVGGNYLIVMTKDKVKVLNNFFYKTINNIKFKEESMSQDSGYLLYKILESLLKNSWMIHARLDNQIKKVEADVYEGRGKKSVFEIADLRRTILQLRAIIDPQRITANSLSRVNVNFLDKEVLHYFDDLDDFVEKNWFSLEGYRDRVLNLQDINESLISYRTSQIMKILTIFSVALLPLTLLSGIYGMNVDLPFAHTTNVVWSLFGLLVIFIVGMFLYLKKKDWI